MDIFSGKQQRPEGGDKTEADAAPLTNAEKTMTRLIMVGAIVVSAAAAMYAGKTGVTMMMGYATAGNAVTLKACAAVSRVAAKFASYLYDVSQGEDIDKAVDKYVKNAPSDILPTKPSIQAATAGIRSEIATLNDRADELAANLSFKAEGPANRI